MILTKICLKINSLEKSYLKKMGRVQIITNIKTLCNVLIYRNLGNIVGFFKSVKKDEKF